MCRNRNIEEKRRRNQKYREQIEISRKNAPLVENTQKSKIRHRDRNIEEKRRRNQNIETNIEISRSKNAPLAESTQKSKIDIEIKIPSNKKTQIEKSRKHRNIEKQIERSKQQNKSNQALQVRSFIALTSISKFCLAHTYMN